jgi:hypothetical protein
MPWRTHAVAELKVRVDHLALQLAFARTERRRSIPEQSDPDGPGARMNTAARRRELADLEMRMDRDEVELRACLRDLRWDQWSYIDESLAIETRLAGLQRSLAELSAMRVEPRFSERTEPPVLGQGPERQPRRTTEGLGRGHAARSSQDAARRADTGTGHDALQE